MTPCSHDGSQTEKADSSISAEQKPERLLPAIPLPSPELCFLNTRPLSCLYGDSHERTHRKLVRRSLLASGLIEAESDEQGASAEPSKNEDGEKSEEEPKWSPSQDEIKKELLLYEDLISYIGLKIANKRNALAAVGIDLGSRQRGFSLLERARRYGVPFLPMHSLVKHIQAQSKALKDNGEDVTTVVTGKRPMEVTDLSERLNDLDSLREDICKLVRDTLQSHTTEAKEEDKKFTLSDLARLPVMDNPPLSLLVPLSRALPEDRLVADILGPLRRKYEVKSSKKRKSTSSSAGKAQEDSDLATPKHSSRPGPRVTFNLEEPATTSRSRRAEETALSDQTDIKSAKVSSPSKTDNDSASTVAGKKASDTDKDKDEVSPENDKENADKGDELKSASSGPEPAPAIPEADMTVEQMVENLMNGKLCNGAEPKSARDLVISIIVAGLYEFLSVDFFKEFLQDRRLMQCFDNIEQDSTDEQ
ncbi:uncharacterized protein BXIN_0429 [Babesia sp. Xinjiang]|uniref:uncharacterized protein n=1 Tax=Babesia sp. Xinjiang TaxID=462227 RepID=UPI000A24DC2E|nr:uncharacterized protein BXIN_0429 [Babesia sp. Xinjiang]ORM41206.1 hypothetical protein BXIN_0429 [Babesia sp. Xinjiang]